MTTMLDTFTRADNASSLGTGESGQVYTVRAGIAGITSNEAYFSDTGGGVLGHAVYNSGLANGYFEVLCNGDFSTGAPSLIFRETDLSNFWSWGSDGTTIVCRKRVADSYTVAYTGSRNVQVGDVFKARCDGSLIYLYLNGTKVATINDSFNSTATNVGIRTSRTTNLFDNLKSSDLEATLSSTLYAASVKTAGAANAANAVGAPDGIYTTDTGGTSWTSSWFMQPFSGGTLIGTQNLKLRVKVDANNANPPTVSTVSLYTPDAVQHVLGSNFTVSGTTGSDISIDFDGGILDGVTDFSQLYIEVVTTGSSGSPKSRESVQLDSITWTTKYVAAGNNYTANPADTGGLTDGFSHTYSIGTQPADNESLTDSQSFVQSSTHTLSDDQALTDSFSLASSEATSVGDSTGLTDSATFLYEVAGTFADSEALSDTFSQSYTMGESLSDDLSLTDNISTVGSSTINEGDSIGITDNLSVNQQQSMSRFDLSNLTDSLVLNSTNLFEVNVADTIGFTDEVSSPVELGRSVTDQVSSTDELAVVQTGTDSYPADVDLTDAVELAQATSTSVSDGSSLTDGLLISQETSHSLIETSNLSDTSTVSLNQVIGLTVPENISDSVFLTTQQSNQFESLSDSTDELITVQNSVDEYLENIGLTDTIEVQLNSSGAFNKSDILGQSDTVDTTSAMSNSVTNNAALSDAVSVDLSVTYNLSADISLTDRLSVLFGSPMASAGSLGISDVLTTDYTCAVTHGNTEGLVDDLSTATESSLDTGDSLALSDTLETGVGGTEDLSNVSGLSDALQVEMLSLLEYTTENDSGISDALTLELFNGVQFQEKLALTDSVGFESSAGGNLGDEAGLTDSLSLELHTELSLTDTVGMDDLFGLLDELVVNDSMSLADGLSSRQYQATVELDLFVGSPMVEWRATLLDTDTATDQLNVMLKLDLARTITPHTVETKWDLKLQDYTTEQGA